MKKTIALATLALAATGAAHAQQRPAASPWSAEIGYTALTIEGSGLKVKPDAVRAIVGYDLHPNVALEGMLAVGVSDDSTTIGTIAGPATVTSELRDAYGLFVKPKFALNDRIEVFGRLGWVNAKVRSTASVAGLRVGTSDRDDDVAYGIGASYRFGAKAYAGIDYMNYYNKNGAKLNGVTFSVGTRF